METKIGILLTNLGTPKSPNKADVKAYLAEFLTDKRVVNAPNKFAWWLVLNLIILNTRPKKSAINYAKIWGRFGSGSPLLDITELQLLGVKKILQKSHDNLEFERVVEKRGKSIKFFDSNLDIISIPKSSNRFSLL